MLLFLFILALALVIVCRRVIEDKIELSDNCYIVD